MQNNHLNTSKSWYFWFKTKAFKIGSLVFIVIAIGLVVLFSKQIGELLDLWGIRAITPFTDSQATPVTDDDLTPVYPPVQFDLDSSFVDEAAATHEVKVILIAPYLGDDPVTVDYVVTDDTTTYGTDYDITGYDDILELGTLTFVSGETSQFITINIFDDPDVEGNETFQIELSDPVNAVLGDPIVHIVTIEDDDPAVQFALGSSAIDEATAIHSVKVILTKPHTENITVFYEVTDISTEPEDYTPLGDGMIKFDPDSTSEIIIFDIHDDADPEGDEDFLITLSSPINAPLGDPMEHIVTIVDDEARHVMSISNPAKYNDIDILRFVDNGIDIHNWTTINGGRMTPYRNLDGSYYLNQQQEELIKELYIREQKIFWIGITTDHLNIYGFPQIYTELANAIDAYIDLFTKETLQYAKVGVYIGSFYFGQDEIITHLRDGYTWQKQYEISEDVRAAAKAACGVNWPKVLWLITGQDYMIHNEVEFQLTNDAQSFWAHHTAVTEPPEAEDLVYHNIIENMGDPNWKKEWEKTKKLTWTDTKIVEGNIGDRQLTDLGQEIFLF